MPQIAIIVGNADLVREGEIVPLVQGQLLSPGDEVHVKENSKVKCILSGGALWYLNSGTRLSIDETVAISENKRRLPLQLLEGEIHIVKRDEAFEEYLVLTRRWSARITAADVTVCAAPEKNRCGIGLLNGFVTFTPMGGTETVVPPCNLLLPGDGGPGELTSLHVSDIASVKSWVGSTVIEEALAASGCTIAEESAVNEPPSWQKLPRENASLNEKIIDTLVAVDPEQTPVRYSLLKGPKGMALDETAGILTYPASSAGSFKVMVEAKDADARICTATVVLKVSPGLTLRLRAPRRVEPGMPVTISAVPQGVVNSRVRYRFDLNGDGRYDFPASGRFGKQAIIHTHIFDKEGVFLLKAEALSNNGMRALSTRKVIVNAPPSARLKAHPEFVTVGTPVTLDVSSSTDTRNGTVPLKVRFDINNDGVWDLPAGKGFLETDKAVYAWSEPGTYSIIAEITDMDGASDSAVVRIVVAKGLAGGSITCPDTVHIGDSVKFYGEIQQSEFPVKTIAWSFDNDTVFEKKATAASVFHVFKKEGLFTVRCIMTDEKGRQVIVARKVTVRNIATSVDAGGPYKARVNSELILTGSATDPDSRVVLYEWDVDGDGRVDYKNEKKSLVRHAYNRAGKYTAIFIVTTEDAKKSRDSALVDISNKGPRAKAVEDIISRKNRKVKLLGTGEDEDGKITRYEWDFDGDGTFDWSSKENGEVEHTFTEYATAVFRVTDSDGSTAADTLHIIICPEGMRTVKAGSFCIDSYEYPNKRNSKPKTDVTFEEAQQLCWNEGKRLCTSEEWEMACNGSKKKFNYPYGKQYDGDLCNTLGNPRLKNSMAVSGYFYECRSDQGVFDMSGNVAEWAEAGNNGPFAYGGSWQNGEQGSSCTSKIQLQQGRKYFYVGFRCCK